MRSGFTTIVLAAAFAACGTSRIGNPGDGGGRGKLQVELTDAPAAFEAVNVTVREVAVHYRGGSDPATARWVTVATDPGTYDLLRLRDGATAVLGAQDVPAGGYDQIRFALAAAEVVTAGASTPVTFPSDTEKAQTLAYGFVVSENEAFTVVLDFDAAASIHHSGDGHYMMMPRVGVMHFGHMPSRDGDSPMMGP